MPMLFKKRHSYVALYQIYIRTKYSTVTVIYAKGADDLFPYIALFALTAIGGFFFLEKESSRKRHVLFLIAITAIMVLMAVIRHPGVGVDYDWEPENPAFSMGYKHYFLDVAKEDFSFINSSQNKYHNEPGYFMLNFLLSRISTDPLIACYGISALIILLRMIAVYKYSSSYWVSIMTYISYGYFMYSFCTFRQELASSIVLFSVPFLQKRRFVPYFFIILLATSIHFSMLLLIPLYFFIHLPINKLTLSLYGSAVLFVLFFSEPVLNLIIRYLPALSAYGPDSYFMQGRPWIYLFFPVIFLIVILLLKNKLLERNPDNIVLINLYTWGTMIFMVVVKHFMAQRVALVLMPVIVLLMPEVFKALGVNEEKYSELSTNANSSTLRYKQLKAQRKSEYESQRALTGMLTIVCFFYLLFMLRFHGLRLTPYVTRWDDVTVHAHSITRNQ